MTYRQKKEVYETPTQIALIKLTHLKALMLKATRNKPTSWTRLLDEVLDIVHKLDAKEKKR